MKEKNHGAEIQLNLTDYCCEGRYRVIYLTDDGGVYDEIPEARSSVIIDSENETILYFGEAYKMRKMECKLLTYLLDNSDRPISKDELYRAVWDYAIVAGKSATLTVHIKRLRDMIELDPKKPLIIKTVWGVGYQLCGKLVKRIRRSGMKMTDL